MKYDSLYSVRKAWLEAIGGDATGADSVYTLSLRILNIYKENPPKPTIKAYPKLDSVEDITTYSGSEYSQLVDRITGKTYMLNSEGAYEEYGLYADSLGAGYEGKLAIVDGNEYKYTNGEWINLGETPYNYTIDLNNDEWKLSDKTYLEQPVYMSDSNWHIANGVATCYIDFYYDGKNDFVLYGRSYGQSAYDYLTVSEADSDVVKKTFKSNSSASVYTAIRYSGLSVGIHRITLIYSKNASTNSYDDRAYFAMYEDRKPIPVEKYAPSPTVSMYDFANTLQELEANEFPNTIYHSRVFVRDTEIEYEIAEDNTWKAIQDDTDYLYEPFGVKALGYNTSVTYLQSTGNITVQYSRDKINWNTLIMGERVHIDLFETLYLRSFDWNGGNGVYQLQYDGECEFTGNIASFRYEDFTNVKDADLGFGCICSRAPEALSAFKMVIDFDNISKQACFDGAFSRATNLRYLPKHFRIDSVTADSTFNWVADWCEALEEVYLPMIPELKSSTYQYAFQYSRALRYVELPSLRLNRASNLGLWLNGVASEGIVVMNILAEFELPLDSSSGVPRGWKLIYKDFEDSTYWLDKDRITQCDKYGNPI